MTRHEWSCFGTLLVMVRFYKPSFLGPAVVLGARQQRARLPLGLFDSLPSVDGDDAVLLVPIVQRNTLLLGSGTEKVISPRCSHVLAWATPTTACRLMK